MEPAALADIGATLRMKSSRTVGGGGSSFASAHPSTGRPPRQKLNVENI